MFADDDDVPGRATTFGRTKTRKLGFFNTERKSYMTANQPLNQIQHGLRELACSMMAANRRVASA